MSTVRIIPLIALMLFLGTDSLMAQEIHEYRLVEVTTYEDVMETSTRRELVPVEETRQVTREKLIWQKETRQRPVVRYEPVTETKERVERHTTFKPVETTRYRQERVVDTSYETVTGYRDEQYTVMEPVTETGMRQERVTVQRPVVENMIEVRRTTSLKPVTETTTQFVEVPGVPQYQLAADPYQRPRLRYLRPGYYTDPLSGLTVYRGRGFHWDQPAALVPVANTPPTLVPQQVQQTRMVPDTVETRRPVELTRMVETTETRQVPYEIRKTVPVTRTRRVPYTYQKPTRTERMVEIPYTETVMREEVSEKRVPYTETTTRRIETMEEYEVEVPKWITETVDEPYTRNVWRDVEVKTPRKVAKKVIMKQAYDKEGNKIGQPIDRYAPEVVPFRGDDATQAQKPSVPDERVLKADTQMGEADKRTTVRKPTSILNVEDGEPTEAQPLEKIQQVPSEQESASGNEDGNPQDRSTESSDDGDDESGSEESGDGEAGSPQEESEESQPTA